MNESNTEKLIKAFPLLYSQCRYFECHDGWFQIIWELSYELEALIEKLNSTPLRDNIDDWDVGILLPCASQVKEKYGTLRFYMETETEEMSKLIEEAEKKSEETCDVCGKPGKLRRGAWLRTLCEDHSNSIK